MPYEYLISTEEGDVVLKTELHHSTFSKIEDFIKEHKDTIAAAYRVSSLTLKVLQIYILHGNSKTKIK